MNENIRRYGKKRLADLLGPKYILKDLATGEPAWDALLDGTKCLLTFQSETGAQAFHEHVIPAPLRAHFPVGQMPLDDWLALLQRVKRQGVHHVSFVSDTDYMRQESIEIDWILTGFTAAQAEIQARQDGTIN